MSTVIDNVSGVHIRLSQAVTDLEGFVGTNRAGLFVYDASGLLAYANNRALQIFGYKDAVEAVGRPLSELEFFFSRAIVSRLQMLLYDNSALKIDQFPGTNLAGHFAYYCLSGNRLNGPKGEALGLVGFIEDVSDQVKKQQELNSRVNELSIVSQISQAVASALDTEEILKIILTGVTARQGLGFNRAFLFLPDAEGRILTGRLAVGPGDAEEAGRIWAALEKDNRSLVESLQIYQENSGAENNNLFNRIVPPRIDLTQDSLFARAVNEKRQIVVDAGSPLDPLTAHILDRLGERQVALTPLISCDRPIGLLVVDNAITHETITPQDKQFLSLIADQTAAAVERSFLYDDLRERAVELERINRRLAETQHQIIEAEKMSVIGQITAAVAHELRNPLTIIGGFANLIKKNVAPDAPEHEYLNIIISETQRAEAVLTDVLDFSRASKTQDACLDLNQLVRQAQDMLAVRMGNGRGRLKVSLCETPLPFWGNTDQMTYAVYQILLILLEDLPEKIVPRLVTFCCRDAARLEIAFDGLNGNHQSVDKILRQYFGVSKNSKRLSLLVAEETLKYHGGTLSIESDTHQGPTLSVQVPLKKEADHGQNTGC